VAAEHLLHRVGDLADGGPGAGRLDAQREQVAVAALGPCAQRRQGIVARGLVALGADPRELGDLLGQHGSSLSTLSTSTCSGSRRR
jgi:hypothetical protein